MTLGEKIKHYRLLKGLTQKELGAAALQNKRNADVRINQYENGFAAPKEDIRTKIADVLDVDIEALSDCCLLSDEDIMYTLFELEETKHLQIHKKDGKIYLEFSEAGFPVDNDLFFSYLNIWENEASKRREDEPEKKAYEKWKGRFVSTVRETFLRKEKELDSFYAPVIERINEESDYFITTSDLVKLLREIIDKDQYLFTRFDNSSLNIVLSVSQMLNPGSNDLTMKYGKILSEIKHYTELGVPCSRKITMPHGSFLVTYSIPIRTFSIIASHINSLQEYYRKEEKTDYSRENFELHFEHDLKKYNNNIAEEIINANLQLSHISK